MHFCFSNKMGLSVLLFFDSCRDSHTVIMCNSTMDSARWFRNYALYQLPPMKQGSSSLGARGDRAKYFKGPIKEIELLGCLKGFCFALILSQIQQLLVDFWKKVFLKLNVIRTKQTIYVRIASRSNLISTKPWREQNTNLHLCCRQECLLMKEHVHIQKQMSLETHMGVSKNRGNPKWMVYFMVPNPIKMDDLGGPPLFLETHIDIQTLVSNDRFHFHLLSFQSFPTYRVFMGGQHPETVDKFLENNEKSLY